MHVFYENVAKYMLSHWMGTFYTNQTLNNEPYVLSKQVWTNIGKKMDQIRKTIPTALGRPPRNIILHHHGYKAEEWAGWITMYSLPLLKDYLPTKYYKGWSFFVQAVQLCQKKVITMDELNNINTLLLKFYVHYER
jgi:hypothetical protein